MEISDKTTDYFTALENRCQKLASNIYQLVLEMPRSVPNIEVGKQLVRSAGSIGANYIEANDSLSHKDFIYRIKIAKKEAKETTYWLSLIIPQAGHERDRVELTRESIELTRIFAAIINKSIAKLD